MVVCGISGRRRYAAAALAIDGRLVAAADHGAYQRAPGAGYAGAVLPHAAVDACLAAAGMSARDITFIVRAEGNASTLETRPGSRLLSTTIGDTDTRIFQISRLAAHARLARAAGAAAVLVADGTSAIMVGADGTSTDLARARSLLALTCRLATALGVRHDDSAEAISALERLAATHESIGHEWFESLAAPPEDRRSVVDVAAFEEALAAAAAEAGAPLSDNATPLVRVSRVVADVAAAFLTMVAAHFGQLIAEAGPGTMLAGGAFGSPDFVARVRGAAGLPCPVAPCAVPQGAAVGAALSLDALPGQPLPEDFALGPIVSEADAKTVLENCRLDYIYEPRWPRLLERVSRILERGKLVAWFQGRAEFGFPVGGSRSILCDPSGRYARDNVNVFLRRLPLATPIPVSLSADVHDCIDTSTLSRWSVMRTVVHPEWRERLRAVVDSEGNAHAHMVRPDLSGPFGEMLAVHRSRTGVPGLINLPLAAPDDAVAITPRDAVRAAFASSADALVIHRFLVMKDYWQMRDELPTGRGA